MSRADLAKRPGVRSVVLAHAFVAGAEPSESERDISVGGVSRVPVSTFDGVDYVALGHLHGCQTITERVRYSGSPLPYSFSEAGHRKSMWLVDLDADGQVTAERIDCPVPRPLARIRGTLEELLADPALARHEAALDLHPQVVREAALHRALLDAAVVADHVDEVALGAAPHGSRAITDALYADVDPRLRRAAERNVIAHLAKLAEDGLVRQDGDGWVRV